MLRLNRPMHRYRGMCTGLSQMAPVFRKKDSQVGFGPERPRFEPATGANERNVASFNMRVNATTAADAYDIPCYETVGGIAFANKPQAIRVS
jgi:hypothetical protein